MGVGVRKSADVREWVAALYFVVVSRRFERDRGSVRMAHDRELEQNNEDRARKNEQQQACSSVG